MAKKAPDTRSHDELLARIDADVRSFKRRTSLFSMLAVLMISSQVTVATFSTMLTVSEYYELGYVFSAITALLVTLEGALAVRERAASAFTAVHRLDGIRLQLLNDDAEMSPYWQEYTDTHASRKVNYLEGIFMPFL